ncbi:hypothetical protein PanWU01x14_177160 [Parasponia andersonii]|uniref:Uncharacterized protein n=1 Tax=Parasponia andersonii TaxID=3476 RepID=A0A2P5C7C7_PARAD|nr:hypothetical protein PanWU01x14_177160 [Parasponia andersonii]
MGAARNTIVPTELCTRPLIHNPTSAEFWLFRRAASLSRTKVLGPTDSRFPPNVNPAIGHKVQLFPRRITSFDPQHSLETIYGHDSSVVFK